ncbi:MAG: VWA domain-containing protein [Flavobacteriales bacterium]|nr:VWA domain-containing protein [Flavobacteriales bacterium]
MAAKVFCFISGILLCFIAFAQQRGIVFENTIVDFGNIKSWDNPPAVFKFENTSFDAQYILAPKTSRKISVDYPRNKIESAEKGEVRVFYYTHETGPFSEDVMLYYSGSNTPIKLTIKGNIKSLADNALTQCPDFNQSSKIELKEKWIEAKVINKITKEPIPLVLVNIGREKFYSQKNGDVKVKLYPGVYGIYAQADGYHPFSEFVGIKNDMGTLIIEMTPLNVPLVKDTIYEEEPIVIKDSIPILPDEKPEFSYREYKANHIVLLLDVSGSMKQRGKIDSLKLAIRTLAENLRSVDRVTLITFASKTNELLINIPGDNKDLILPVVESLTAKGTTDGVLGIEKAYQHAFNYFILGGNNQVIVATDGIFNSPKYSESQLLLMIKSFRNKGIKLSVIGFGKEKNAISAMQKMSTEGGGNYISFSENNNVKKLLLEEIKNQSKR